MRIIEPSVEILTPLEPELLINIERAGRTCYKSDLDKDGNIKPITIKTADDFVRMLIGRGHEAMIEHGYVTVKFVCDRGVSHEIVRHRIAAYAQESTRYCNYSKSKFGNEISFIKPLFFNKCPEAVDTTCLEWADHCNECYKYFWWETIMEDAEISYLQLIELGAKPEQARSVLPNSLKTEIVCTFNLREWRHFFKLRCAPAAHPQMRQVALPLYYEFLDKIPALVEDIIIDEKAYENIPFAEVTYNQWKSSEEIKSFTEELEPFKIEWIKEED